MFLFCNVLFVAASVYRQLLVKFSGFYINCFTVRQNLNNRRTSQNLAVIFIPSLCSKMLPSFSKHAETESDVLMPRVKSLVKCVWSSFLHLYHGLGNCFLNVIADSG